MDIKDSIMELNLKQLKELVIACDGDSNKVEDYINNLKDKLITTLKELSDYPFKENYSDVFAIKKSTKLNKLLKSFEPERYRTYYLDEVIECSADNIRGEYGYLIDEELSDEELICKYNPELAKELIDLKFGSVVWDW